jgi:hypothetical protein
MNKSFSIFIILLFLISCGKTEAIEEELITDPVEEIPTTIINPGDVTDILIYNSKPYYQNNAGYTENDFINLPPERNLNFVHIVGKSDTEELEKIINELTSKGGGKITIKSGEYTFRDVLLKSNIHITIESGTIIKLENQNEGKNAKNGKRHFFSLSGSEVNKPLENVRIIGLGSTSTRPKLILEKFFETWGNTFNRAISLGYVKNALIENLSIVDDYTLGAAIAFNPVDINNDNETAQIAENVTITNISLTNGSIGYGLVQTNVGKNILLKNLSSQGGMTCRIEAHTGRKYDLGVDNIVVKNVASIQGKAAVLLQPHSVLNGRVLVDVAKSEGSSWTLFIKEGFVGSDSKRKAKGNFAATSKFTNISMVSTDNNATLSYKNYSFIPTNLKPLYKEPNFVYIPEDSNHKIENGIPGKESPIVGPSIAVIYNDAKYSLSLPEEEELIISGQIENRLKIFRR